LSAATWVNGTMLPEGLAGIDPLDHGVTVGDGLFETVRVIDGRTVFWVRHLRRLRRAAARIGLDVSLDDATLTSAASQVLHAAGVVDGRLRVTVTSGPGPLGPIRPTGPTTVVIAAAASPPAPDAARVVTVPWVRNERSPLAGLKSTSYGEGVVILTHARAHGAEEALLADTTGRLSEAVTANVFVGVGGVLLTPTLEAGCLPGIVREVLLERGVGAASDIPMGVVGRADEIFLTSSTRGVTPVSHVDGRALPSVGGPLTTVASEDLAVAVTTDLSNR